MDQPAAGQPDAPGFETRTLGDVTLVRGDCLDVVPSLTPGSVSMVFADVPYSVRGARATNQQWDRTFPLSALMQALALVVQKSCMYSFTANDRLAAKIVTENEKLFRYSLIWQKSVAGMYYHAKKRPLLKHEWIQILGPTAGTYNPVTTVGTAYRTKTAGKNRNMRSEGKRFASVNDGTRMPTTLLNFGLDQKTVHPTQKPVALLEWLIATYTNPGDLVLDPTAGSGTTGIAALNLGRRAVLIEKDPTYFEVMCSRINEHQQKIKSGRADNAK